MAKYQIRAHIKSYNCAMGTIDHMQILSDGGLCYNNFDSKKISAKEIKESVLEFLEWLRDPGPKYASGGYDRNLAFFVFHDNQKMYDIYQNIGESIALRSLKGLFLYLYLHQKELGCTVWRTDLVDNLWHGPVGSHPGRVYVLTPPHVVVFKPGVKVGAPVKKALATTKELLVVEDKKIVDSIIAA